MHALLPRTGLIYGRCVYNGRSLYKAAWRVAYSCRLYLWCVSKWEKVLLGFGTQVLHLSVPATVAS